MAFTEFFSELSGLSPKGFQKNTLKEGNPPDMDSIIASAILWGRENNSTLSGKKLVDDYLINNKDRFTNAELVSLRRKVDTIPSEKISNLENLDEKNLLATRFAAVQDADKILTNQEQRRNLDAAISNRDFSGDIVRGQVPVTTREYVPSSDKPTENNSFLSYINRDTSSPFDRIARNPLAPIDRVPIQETRSGNVVQNNTDPSQFALQSQQAGTPFTLDVSGNTDVDVSKMKGATRRKLAEAAANAKGRKPRGATPEVPKQPQRDPLLDHGAGQSWTQAQQDQFDAATSSEQVQSDPRRAGMPDYLKRAIGSFGFNTLGVPFLLSRANRLRGESQNLRKILAQQTPERRVQLSQVPVTGLPKPSIPITGRQGGGSLLEEDLRRAQISIARNQALNRFAQTNKQFMLQQARQNQQIVNQESLANFQNQVGRDRFENQIARNFAGRELYGYSLPQRDDAISGALSSVIGAGKRAGQIYNRGKLGSTLTDKDIRQLARDRGIKLRRNKKA